MAGFAAGVIIANRPQHGYDQGSSASGTSVPDDALHSSEMAFADAAKQEQAAAALLDRFINSTMLGQLWTIANLTGGANSTVPLTTMPLTTLPGGSKGTSNGNPTNLGAAIDEMISEIDAKKEAEIEAVQSNAVPASLLMGV